METQKLPTLLWASPVEGISTNKICELAVFTTEISIEDTVTHNQILLKCWASWITNAWPNTKTSTYVKFVTKVRKYGLSSEPQGRTSLKIAEAEIVICFANPPCALSCMLSRAIAGDTAHVGQQQSLMLSIPRHSIFFLIWSMWHRFIVG